MRSRNGLALAILLMAMGSAGVASAGESAEPAARPLERATRKLEKGNFKAAADLFSEADRLAEGRSVEAVAGLGRAHLALGHYDEAIEAAQRWVALASTPSQRAAGHHHLGLALLRRGVAEVAAAASRMPLEATDETEKAGAESLRRAAQAYRSAADEATEGRQFVLLGLAEALVLTASHAEALQVLDEYAAAGGGDPRAADLRCWAERAGGGRGGDQEVRKVAGEIQPPVKVSAPMPEYTTAARKAGIQGSMHFVAILDERGSVACIRTLQGMPYGMTEAALAAIKKWKFEPARLEGRPVPVFYSLHVNFSQGRSSTRMPGPVANRP